MGSTPYSARNEQGRETETDSDGGRSWRFCTREAKVMRNPVPPHAVIPTLVLNQCVAAEEETRLLGTVENKLGMANWLKDEGHEWVRVWRSISIA